MRTATFIARARRPAQDSQPKGRGFTLVELLVVITVMALLASMLFPALSRAKANGLATVCLNNLNQLALGWHIYTLDHNDSLPSNKWRAVNWEDDCPTGFQTSADCWVLGDTTVDRDTWGIQNGSLFPYVHAAQDYHCPADHSRIDSWPQLARTRSYSMSYYMNGSERKPERKTKWSQIGAPERVFVFLEEHENSINDGVFYVHVPYDAGEQADGPHWMDLPANRHGGGCNLLFADAHGEHWTWKWGRHTQPDARVVNGLDLQDLRRLQTGIPAR